MANGQWRGRGPWPVLFVVGCAALAGSVAFAFALFTASEPSGGGAQPGSAALPSPTAVLAPDSVYYSGNLPGPVAGLDLRPADARHPPDLQFEGGELPGGTTVVRQRFVPVVSIWAGLDGVESTVLAGLLAGRLTLAEAGGLGGRPTFAVTSGYVPVGSSQPARVFAGVGEMALAFADPAAGPFIAFVTVRDLRPSFVPLRVDGRDVLRDPDAWEDWPFAERSTVRGLTARGEDAVPIVVAALSEKHPTVTRIVATGDVLMARCSLTRIRATGDWGSPLRTPLGQYLAAADLALTSLDASIQDIGPPFGCVETTNLTSPAEVIEALKVAGIDEATVATNHAADCGQGGCGLQALTRMLELLSSAGIKTVGGGRNLEEALAPAIFTVNGIRVGVLGFDDIAAEELEATATAPGTAPLDDSYENERATEPREPAFYKPAELLGLTRFEERIHRLKAEVDIVIIQVQSGYEDTHDASPRSVKALRAAAAAGADLVIGNQGHWVQPVEFRGDSFVAYALGNFIFDQVRTREHTEGYLVEATLVDKRLAAIRLLPYRIEDQYRPTFVEGEARLKVLRDVFQAAARLPK